MPKMRAVQVFGPNSPFEIVERDIPEPKNGTVRVKVQACVICHSDSFTKEGTYPGIIYWFHFKRIVWAEAKAPAVQRS